MAQGEKLFPEFLGVVELAVVGDGSRAAARGFDHGLAAAGQVDDGQAHMGQARVGGKPDAGIVRPSPALDAGHGCEDVLIMRLLGCIVFMGMIETGDAAHSQASWKTDITGYCMQGRERM